MRCRVTAALLLACLATGALAPAPVAVAEEPASGTFTMTTAPGIMPAWTSAGISMSGIYPGSVTTSRFANDATITLPVVARAKTANATAGGFRITNTDTGTSVRCLIPVIDTKALVIDCLTNDGFNIALFSIEEIQTRQSFTTPTTRTTLWRGMDLRLTTAGAQTLNRALETNVFSTSVRTAEGNLSVARDR